MQLNIPGTRRALCRSARRKRPLKDTGSKHRLTRIATAAVVAPLILVAAACGNDTEDNGGTPAPNGVEPTPTATAPAVDDSNGTDGDEATPAPTPSDPPSADTVSLPVAFPDLSPVERPVAMVEIPGQDRFLLLLQEGRVLSFPKDERASEFVQVLDWRDRTSREGNEEGLLGVAVSPNFEDDGYVYLYYSARPGERRSVVSRFEVTGTGSNIRIDPGSELIILEVPQPFSNHNAGHIEFGPDGMLYIALGDGGSGGDPQGHGQNVETLLGSILRIDVSEASPDEPYAVPDDNPLVGQTGARQEIWAWGFRNPWRFSFDQETGRLWVADVGQSTREEVNVVEGGGNYGWNIMEGFTCFTEPNCDQEGLELPVVDYPTGANCSITGGYVGRGDVAGSLRGYYVYGDYCSGAVWTIPADSEPGSQPEQITLRDSGPSLPSFAQDLDGRIYILSFDGRIYRVDGEASPT